MTKKHADFLLFKQVVDLVIQKQHLNEEGLKKILSIRASMNKGLTPALKTAFPNIIPEIRPIVDVAGIPEPQWVVGFTSGEGCFFLSILVKLRYPNEATKFS